MNRRTRDALKSSIAHWNRHATGKAKKGEGIHSYDCALCKLFLHNNNGALECGGCPVKERTGQNACVGSPWYAANLSHFNGAAIQSDKFKRKAARMRDFLKSLLPKAKK